MEAVEQAEWDALEARVLGMRAPCIAAGGGYLGAVVFFGIVGYGVVGIRTVLYIGPLLVGILPALLLMSSGLAARPDDPRRLLLSVRLQLALWWVVLAETVLLAIAGTGLVAYLTMVF